MRRSGLPAAPPGLCPQPPPQAPLARTYLSERGRPLSIERRELRCSAHRWSSGRILPCHGRDPGSIPGRCSFFFCVFACFFCFLRPDQYPNDPPGVLMVQLVKLHRRSLSSTVRCASSRPAPTVQSQLLYSRMHDEGLRIDHTPFSNGQTTYPESPPPFARAASGTCLPPITACTSTILYRSIHV